MPNILKNKAIIGIILFSIIFLMGIPLFNLPHFWDGTLWVNSAEWMSRNNLNPVLPGSRDYGGLDVGHPPFLFLSLASAFQLFGTSLIVSHFVMMIFAFLTAYFTYLLGSYLYNEKIGFLASITLLSFPLFYAQSHIINLDLPLAAFTLITIYFALKNKTIHYLISGSLLVLTKEPGMLTILAIVIYVFIKNFKEPKISMLKKCLLYSLPLLALISWIAFHWIQQNQVVLGHSSMWRPITPVMFLRFLNRIKVFFFDEFRWIITLSIIISLLPNVKKVFNLKRALIALTAGILSFFIFTYSLKLLLNNVSLLKYVVSLAQTAFTINEKHLKEILLSFYSYRIIFAVFIAALALLFKNNTSFSAFKNKKFVPIYLTFVFYLILFSWTFFQPRYNLPLIPLFLIFAANAINNIFKKNLAYLATAAIIILLITQWGGNSNDTRGYLLEKNLEYKDSILTHKNMVSYIENNFPDATILSYSFMTDELRYPHLGYAKRSFNPIDYSHYNPKTKKTDFTLNTDDWYYYKCYSKNQCNTNNLMPVGKGDVRVYDNRYKEYLADKDFDLFYYSPQSPFPKSLINLVDDFNLVLIKRFEKNGKYTELYATNKFLSKTNLK